MTKSSGFLSASWFSRSEVVALESWRHEKRPACQATTLFGGLPPDSGSSVMGIETSSVETPAHPSPPLYSSLSSNYCGTAVSMLPGAGKLREGSEAVA